VLVVGLGRWLPCLNGREYLGRPSRGLSMGKREGRIMTSETVLIHECDAGRGAAAQDDGTAVVGGVRGRSHPDRVLSNLGAITRSRPNDLAL